MDLQGIDLFRQVLGLARTQVNILDPALVDNYCRSALHEGLDSVHIYRGTDGKFRVKFCGHTPGVPVSHDWSPDLKEQTVVVSEEAARNIKGDYR